MKHVDSYEIVDFRTFVEAEPESFSWNEVKRESIEAARTDRADLHKRGLIEPMTFADGEHRSRITVPYFYFGSGKIAETVIVMTSRFVPDRHDD